MQGDYKMSDKVEKPEEIQYCFGMFKKGNEWQVIRVPYLPSETASYETLRSTVFRDEAREAFKIEATKIL